MIHVPASYKKHVDAVQMIRPIDDPPPQASEGLTAIVGGPRDGSCGNKSHGR